MIQIWLVLLILVQISPSKFSLTDLNTEAKNQFGTKKMRAFSPVSEEFDDGVGGGSVAEHRIEIGDVQIDGVVADIGGAGVDGAEDRPRSRRGERDSEQAQDQKKNKAQRRRHEIGFSS